MTLPHIGLFGRLFILFSITTISLAAFIALGVFVMSESDAKNILRARHDNIVSMLQHAMTNEDKKEVAEEAKKNKVQLLIINNGKKWSTLERFPEIDNLMRNEQPIGSLHFAKYKSNYYLLYNDNENWIVATSLAANLLVYRDWLASWPWFSALIVLLFSYLILKKMLRPVNEAIESTQMISQGNFDHRIEKHPKTELAQLTRGLNKMAADLKQLFEAKDELLLAISHELRTPMARMTVSLAMLEQNNIVHDLSNDIKQMNYLIEQLLEGERLQQGHKVLSLSTYFLPNLIDELLDEQGLENKVTLDGPPPEFALTIDVGRIKFLLRNLLQNAINYSTPHTEIVLKIRKIGHGLEFQVIDQGPGIPIDSLDRIFEPFYRVEHINNRSTNGIGLGLYLCQRIAQAHDGELTVSNNEGKGSCFNCRLPQSCIVSS